MILRLACALFLPKYTPVKGMAGWMEKCYVQEEEGSHVNGKVTLAEALAGCLAGRQGMEKSFIYNIVVVFCRFVSYMQKSLAQNRTLFLERDIYQSP